jgi:glycosyltransferase involved in cell wall biosynthesis
MKILHLSNVIGERKGGGVHEVVSNFYKYQKFEQHEPHIWYPGLDKDADSIRLDNNIKGLSTIGSSKFGLIKGLFKPLPKNIGSFDIIHQHGIWMPISLFSKKIKKYSGIKSVIQPHGYLEPFRLEISKYKKKAIYSIYEKSNLLSSSCIVACSEDEGIKLKTMFPNNEVAVIPNGVSLEFYSEPSMRGKHEKNKKKMLFLSQIIPIKGLERLFEVMAEIGVHHFSEWEFLIAGYEDKGYLRLLKNMVMELKLDKLVSFVGPKHGKDKVEIFDNADVFILPTFNENYGIVIAEALSRGVPVITTKGTPWKELDTNECGFWVDNTKEGIRLGLLTLLDTPQSELKKMGLRGRKLIKNKYLWDRTTLKTIKLYEWVLNGGTKPDFFI